MKLEGDAALLKILLDDACKLDREYLAKQIESGRFCDGREHMLGECSCREIAEFIRTGTPCYAFAGELRGL